MENPRKHGKFPKRFYIKEFLGGKKKKKVGVNKAAGN